jgi:hypothetical protein
VFDVVLCFSFDGFFVYVSKVFEEINPRSRSWFSMLWMSIRLNLICRKTLSFMRFVM